MFFLIVDDELDLDAWKRNLEYEFPGAVVHTAASTDEAREAITFAERREFGYDVVILDFKLPPTRDGTPVLDLETRQRVQESVATRRAVVFHITAYPDDPGIREWVRQQKQLNPSLVEPCPIDKNDTLNWAPKLMDGIRRAIYENRVESRLDLLLGGAGSGGTLARRARGVVGAPFSVTQELSALTTDIEKHWDYLSKGLQNRCREVFHKAGTSKPDPIGEDGQ